MRRQRPGSKMDGPDPMPKRTQKDSGPFINRSCKYPFPSKGTRVGSRSDLRTPESVESGSLTQDGPRLPFEKRTDSNGPSRNVRKPLGNPLNTFDITGFFSLRESRNQPPDTGSGRGGPYRG